MYICETTDYDVYHGLGFDNETKENFLQIVLTEKKEEDKEEEKNFPLLNRTLIFHQMS